VGTAYYPGAYQQYIAHVWGIPIDVKMTDIESIKVDYLLADGTGYYYGSYPEH
jgi:DNA-binding beta-propeller fold protein YncE